MLSEDLVCLLLLPNPSLFILQLRAPFRLESCTYTSRPQCLKHCRMLARWQHVDVAAAHLIVFRSAALCGACVCICPSMQQRILDSTAEAAATKF